MSTNTTPADALIHSVVQSFADQVMRSLEEHLMENLEKRLSAALEARFMAAVEARFVAVVEERIKVETNEAVLEAMSPVETRIANRVLEKTSLSRASLMNGTLEFTSL